jgi:hypothetical protein
MIVQYLCATTKQHLNACVGCGGCNPHHRYLISLDIAGFDWNNDKPVTSYFNRMIDMNLTREQVFLRDFLIAQWFKASSTLFTRTCTELHSDFKEWLQKAEIDHKTDVQKFGHKLTSYLEGEQCIEGVTKKRRCDAQTYIFDVDVVVASMIEKKWISSEEILVRDCIADDDVMTG